MGTDDERPPIEAYEDEEDASSLQVGDLVRFSAHLFPPEAGSTTYYAIGDINEHTCGIIVRIQEPLLLDDQGYLGDYFVGHVSLRCQYYEVWWLDGKGITAEKHYDLELLSSGAVDYDKDLPDENG